MSAIIVWVSTNAQCFHGLKLALTGIRENPSAGTTGFTDGINSDILRYSGATDDEPTTIQNTEGAALDEADLHPLENPGAVSGLMLKLLYESSQSPL